MDSKKTTLSRLLTDLISIAAVLAVVPTLFTQVLDKREEHYARVKSAVAPLERQVQIINQAMKAPGKNEYLTSEVLHRYAASFTAESDVSFLDPILNNPKTASKSPAEQDTIHRIQLLELKANDLETKIEKLSNKDEPWWKNPSTLWLVALLWLCEKIFSRVVGDLISIAWPKAAKKLGLSIPKGAK